MSNTVRLTTARALVRWLVAQRSELLDGTEVPLFAGVFGIFGHGNVLGLGTALYEVRDQLPTWRGQTEEGMALAAVGFAKATDRRQVMAATSSIGPGALNMVTAAGLAHANRLPVLLLPGDTFTGRAPDPVLQQVEVFVRRDGQRQRRVPPGVALLRPDQPAGAVAGHAAAGGPGAHRPGRLRSGGAGHATGRAGRGVRLPGAHVRAAPAPRAAGPARCRRSRCGGQLLRSSRRPLIVSGGGVRYSGAGGVLLEFAAAHGAPVAETVGRPHGGARPAPAQRRAARHHRLRIGQRARCRRRCRPGGRHSAAGLHHVVVERVRAGRAGGESINAARFDAVKHGGHAVVGDARESLAELDAAVAGLECRPGVDRPGRRRARPLGFAHRLVAVRRRPGRRAQLRPGGRRRQRRERAGRLCARLVGRHPGRTQRRLAHGFCGGWADHGSRVRLLVHGLRDRRAVGRCDGAGAQSSRMAWSRRCSATGRT